MVVAVMMVVAMMVVVMVMVMVVMMVVAGRMRSPFAHISASQLASLFTCKQTLSSARMPHLLSATPNPFARRPVR